MQLAGVQVHVEYSRHVEQSPHLARATAWLLTSSSAADGNVSPTRYFRDCGAAGQQLHEIRPRILSHASLSAVRCARQSVARHVGLFGHAISTSRRSFELLLICAAWHGSDFAKCLAQAQMTHLFTNLKPPGCEIVS